MKNLTATAALLLLVPALASSQEVDHPSRGQGYIFIGPILSNTRYVFNPAYAGVVFPNGTPPPSNLFIEKRGGVNTGFGADFFHGGLGVGFEAGYAAPDWSFGNNGYNGRGVVSIDASYHFFSKKNHGRTEPFVVGGYSLYYGDRTATQNGFNIGGGLNFWVAQHAALRFEVRDQEHVQYFITPFPRFVALRPGVTFR